jgi:Mycothiol-dependent nitroreductase Rv2466c
VTARWVVDEVKPARDLQVPWQPISLLFKNEPDENSQYYAAVAHSHRMLRVMEALRESAGDEAVFAWYWECGSRIHHDGDKDFDLAEALSAAGLDPALAAAAEDESWDSEISKRMDTGLALAGDDIGTPIIAMDGSDGVRQGIFGPVITRVPPTEQSLTLWDGMVAMMSVPGFWELKRTRTERPEFGERP